MVKISQRLPELGVWVTIIDSAGEHRVYRRTEYGWNMRDADGDNSPNNNLDLVYWLERVHKTYTSEAIVGKVDERIQQIRESRLYLCSRSFRNGWVEGRIAMLNELYFIQNSNQNTCIRCGIEKPANQFESCVDCLNKATGIDTNYGI